MKIRIGIEGDRAPVLRTVRELQAPVLVSANSLYRRGRFRVPANLRGLDVALVRRPNFRNLQTRTNGTPMKCKHCAKPLGTEDIGYRCRNSMACLRRQIACLKTDLDLTEKARDRERTLARQAREDLENYQKQFAVMEEAMLKINAACSEWREFLGT